MRQTVGTDYFRAMQAKQAALKRHTSQLIMGPGQEADDIKAIQVEDAGRWSENRK